MLRRLGATSKGTYINNTGQHKSRHKTFGINQGTQNDVHPLPGSKSGHLQPGQELEGEEATRHYGKWCVPGGPQNRGGGVSREDGGRPREQGEAPYLRDLTGRLGRPVKRIR